MALQHVRSSTANKRPVATNLADGQIGVNYHADSPGLFAKDSNNALFKIGPIHVGTTAPNVTPAGSSGNSKGEGWLDTSGSNAVLKVWNGTSWSTVIPVASGNVVSTADTGTVTSTMIADGTITNTDINASAAIALSKLATGALPTAITVASANIVDGTIVNGDINASAAIAHSKLANITAGQVLLGNASNVPTATALSGDVTVTSTGVTAIKSSVALTGTPTAPTAGAGTNTTQIATTAFVKSAVDAAKQGLTYKAACRVATTSNITLSATQTIDGVAVIANDRVLVKNQTTGSQNGIYVVAAGAWTRATDFDATADLADGAFVFVEEGTSQGDTGWVLSTDGTITVGTTALTFIQFSGAGSYTAGNGLQLSGTQFSLAALPSANLLIGNSSDVATATAVTGDVTISNTGVTAIGTSKVTNLMLAGSIADSKLSTISTAGKVANTATTATNANTASAIVARDASGNFSAGTITAGLSGNATTATTLQTARTINGVSFNGSANITVTANTPSTVTFNNGGAGGASGSTFNGSGALTVSYNTVGALGASQKAADSELIDGIDSARLIYGQNGSGINHLSDTQNVYELGQYKAGFWDVTGAAWTPTTDYWWGATFAHVSNSSSYNYSGQLAFKNGGGGDNIYGRTVSNGTAGSWSRLLSSGNYNSYAPTLTGTGASGTWSINVTGNAATATNLSSNRTFALTGDITGSVSSNLSSGASIATSIAAGAIVNADVNASAAIAGTKISPNFGSQAVTTTGTITGASLIPTSSTAPTNGIYLPAADTVGIATGGTERLRISSLGRIFSGNSYQDAVFAAGGATGGASGVQKANGFSARQTMEDNATNYGFISWPFRTSGSTSGQVLNHFCALAITVGDPGVTDTQYGFHASSFLTGATNNYGFFSNIASGTGRWNFYANGTADNYFAGDVGIGINTPLAKLHINGTGQTALVTPVTYGNSQDSPYLIASTTSHSGASTNWGTYGFQHRIKSSASGIGRVTIDTYTGEAFCVDNNGRVGIGTTGPSCALEVSRLGSDLDIPSVEASTAILATAGGGLDTSGASITLAGGNASSCSVYFGDTDNGAIGGVLYNHALDTMYFRINGSTRITLNSTGNLGVGTTGPADKLDVNGSIRLSGSLKSSSTAAVWYSLAGTGYVGISGGTSSALGANIICYGESHATVPGRLLFRDGATTRMMIFDSTGNVHINSSADQGEKLYVNGTIRSNGQIKTIAGDTVSAPGFTWAGDEDTGIFKPLANTVGITAGGAEVCRLDFGGTSGIRRQYFNGSVEVVSSASLYLEGTVVRSSSVRDTTTTSAANIFMNSSTGQLFRSTSSIKYKDDVQTIPIDASEQLIYGARPVSYKSLCADDPKDARFWGFIAEEIAELDHGLVHWGGENGEEPEGVQYERFVVHLVKVAQEQKALLDSLQSRIEALESNA